MKIKNFLLIILGYIFLLLGAIGVFLPIWPTTPFILLAVACFSSSPKLKAQILRINLFREHIENYNNRQGLSRLTVIKSLAFLWITMIISALFIQKLWLTALLAIIGIGVTSHILYIAKPKIKDCPANK